MVKRSLDSVEGSGSALTRWALLLWCIQPLSILIEFVVAGFVQVPYSFVDNTISDLGAVTCTEIPYPAELVPVCSPAHALLNGGFIGLGAALVVGAAFLLRSQPRSRLLTIALALWLICGLSIIATGLVPARCRSGVTRPRVNPRDCAPTGSSCPPRSGFRASVAPMVDAHGDRSCDRR